MRKAVMVVGKHRAGKSKTIRLHLKKKLGIAKSKHKFSLRGKEGFVLSQSREEAAKQQGFVLSQSLEESGKYKNVAKIVTKYSLYDLLVLAARPRNEKDSCLNRLERELRKAGYRVTLVSLNKHPTNEYCEKKANEILKALKGI